MTEKVPQRAGPEGLRSGGGLDAAGPAQLTEASCPDLMTLLLPLQPLLFLAPLSLGPITSPAPCRLHARPAAHRGDKSHIGPLSSLQRQGGGYRVPPTNQARCRGVAGA